jgi:hypothetical protein
LNKGALDETEDQGIVVDGDKFNGRLKHLRIKTRLTRRLM